MSAGLAPEAVAGVQSVLADLDREIAAGKFTGDPALGHLMVTRATVSAMHRLMVDGVLTLKAAMQTQPVAPLLTLAEEKRFIEDIKSELRSALYKQATSAHRHITWRVYGVLTTIWIVSIAAIGAGGYWWAWTQSAERNIETQSILGAMPARAASDWAQIVRLNPPPSAWTPKPYTAPDGSTAIEIPLRLTPIPLTAATASARK